MEGGFRRLWSRKKSVSSVDQQSHPRNITSSNGFISAPQPILNTTKDGRTSTSSRDIYSPNSGNDRSHSKSSHRIQPMLVGISRPEINKDRTEPVKDRDRPDTAGSLQHAVQKAADSVGRNPPETSASQPIPISTPLKPLTRHVDIFSIASSIPSYLSRYNEEVAERNLDTYRLVLESTPYVYNPSSRYQEEVAIRNAYLPYRNKPSTDTMRRSMDHERTTSITTRSVRSIVTPQANGTHAYQPSYDLSEAGNTVSQEQGGHHHRQASQRSRDGTQLPSIPQEYNEDGMTENEGLKVYTQAPYSPTHSFRRPVAPNPTLRDDRMHTINEGQPYETASSTATTSATPRDSGHSNSSHVFSDYKISAAEYGYRSVINRTASSDRPVESRGYDSAIGPAPPRSTASSIKKQIILPHRTIMDLTNDDPEIFSDTSSAYVSNYSPVIEQAKSDAFHRVAPSEIHTEERRGSKGAQQFDQMLTTPTKVNGVKVIEVMVPHPQMMRATSDAEELGGRYTNSSSFSPISTVASWSPRSSAYVVKPVEPLSMTARVQAALENAKAIAQDSPLPISAGSGAEVPIAKDRAATYQSMTARSVPQAVPIAAANTKTYPTKPPADMQTPPKAVAQPSQEKPMTTPSTKATEGAPYTPSIYTSPNSINSVDYINPSSAFGVRTRDFALSPRESTPLIKKATAPKPADKSSVASPAAKSATRPKSAKPRTKPNTPATTKPKDTGFDEEAFKRKQAEARAALERLQRSLSEDFITLPDRATLKSAKGKEPELDGRQSAPALILPQEPKVPVPTVPRTENEKPPPSAFRNSRGESSKSALPSNSRSLSAGKTSSRRAPVPSSLKNVEPANSPIDPAILSPALLQAIQFNANPPKSPGEISLSSFPVPSSRPSSQPDVPPGYHSHNSSIVGAMKRRNSTKSQTSTTSAFSIPYYMVPGRSSSVRDPVPEEGDTIWA